MRQIGGLFLTIVVVFLFSGFAHAGFNWGNSDGKCSGGGEFNELLEKDVIKFVGEIPIGNKGISVKMSAQKDLDIQLYDKLSGDKIVAWSADGLHGILWRPFEDTTEYEFMNIGWSGYMGDCPNFDCPAGTSPGNEYIKVDETKRELTMKAFAYRSGTALVQYSWTGTVGCVEGDNARNGDSFTTILDRGKRTYLGVIPPGLDNPVVFLKATNDLDIELYDSITDEFIVGWKSEHIDSFKKITGIYKADKITWSGWNGRYNAGSWIKGFNNKNISAFVSEDIKSGISMSSERGRESIRIHGKSNGYKMYVYAYQSGSAEVEYSWGVNPIYAGILGMGLDYLQSESNSNPFMYPAINGVMPELMTSFYSPSYAGYGHTLIQADRLVNGINVSYVNGEPYIAGKNMKGQVGVAVKLSNYRIGSGDINIFSSGNVQYIYNRLVSQINENANNIVFISGHSSGGGDTQDLLWKFSVIGQSVKASFQIDSIEIELSNWGLLKSPQLIDIKKNLYVI